MKNEKVWQSATLQPLEENGQVIPFWKPPISNCLDPGGHGGGRTFRAQKPKLEIPSFFARYCRHLFKTGRAKQEAD